MILKKFIFDKFDCIVLICDKLFLTPLFYTTGYINENHKSQKRTLH